MEKFEQINMDAFSDGQMASKLWLCEQLEKSLGPEKRIANTWIYGSWYGLLPFLLLSRGHISFEKIHLFDIDLKALEISKKILNHWQFGSSTQIEYHNQDCTVPNPLLPLPDLIINTSAEHFQNYDWWKNIQKPVTFIVQSTDMEHAEHISKVSSLSELKNNLGIFSTLFEGTKEFNYPNFQFKRFMVIGSKNRA